MSDPLAPGRPLEGLDPGEANTEKFDLGRAAPGAPNAPWSAPRSAWEPSPPQTGWTRLPGEGWSPAPRSEATGSAPPPPDAGSQPPRASLTGSPRRRQRFARVAANVLLLATGMLLGVAIGYAFWASHPPTATQAQPAGGSGPGSSGGFPFGYSGSGGSSGSAAGAPSDVSAIASRVDPALVDINLTLGYGFDQAEATGIVLNSSGLVLTNNHVIDGATAVTATDIGNGRSYSATVVGYDTSQDVALIQLHGASGLTTARLGDSSKVRVRQAAVAIGNAGGVGGTPSAAGGSVVALDQHITANVPGIGTSERLSGLIETNADVKPGDSGGPLVNTAGQVIAVDTAASSGYLFSSSGSQGFAIPVNTAMAVVTKIENNDASATVHIGATAFLGVELEGSGAQSSSGVTITGVVWGTPAAGTGLAAGDTIVSVNGQSVDSPTAFTTLVGGYRPGDRVTIGWTSPSGAQHESTVQLASGPAH